MKRILCLTAMLALTACDRPQNNVQLSCESIGGKYLIDATMHKTHADLKIQKVGPGSLDFFLIERTSWLAQQMPEIDDTITLTLPIEPGRTADRANGYRGAHYVLEKQLELDVREDRESGSVEFVLGPWFDNEELYNMSCKIVFNYQPVQFDKIPADKLHDIKQCVGYVSQTLMQYNGKYLVRDADTQNLVVIERDKMSEIMGVKPENMYHYFYANLAVYQEEVLDACDVAARLREYARANAGPSQQKLYKCIMDVHDKIRRNYESNTLYLDCPHVRAYDLTAEQALALSPAFDYSNLREYEVSKHILAEHEQDACAVLERVNAAMEQYCEKPTEQKSAQ